MLDLRGEGQGDFPAKSPKFQIEFGRVKWVKYLVLAATCPNMQQGRLLYCNPRHHNYFTYLMEFTASKMDFPSPYCILSPGKHLRNINIDPSELRENLTWNPVEGYIIRYPYISTNVFRTTWNWVNLLDPKQERTTYLPDVIHCV